MCSDKLFPHSTACSSIVGYYPKILLSIQYHTICHITAPDLYQARQTFKREDIESDWHKHNSNR